MDTTNIRIKGARLVKKPNCQDSQDKTFAIQSTTGTSISTYIDWIVAELSKKSFGEVAIRFIVMRGQVVDVRKESMDSEHFPLLPDKK